MKVTLALVGVLLPALASAKAMTFFKYSECEISHVAKKTEYAEVVNEVKVKTSERMVPSKPEACSKETIRQAAFKIAKEEGALPADANPLLVSPVRCGTIPGRSGTDFILVESSFGGMPETIAYGSIFQIFSIQRSSKKAVPVPIFGLFLDKKNLDNSANLKAICSDEKLIIEKCGKLGCDYQILKLDHSKGIVEVEEIEGGWGD